jgi:probable rRNA maturation factor
LIKNLQVSSQDISINKEAVHKLILLLKNEFQIEISSLSISFISSNKLREINEQFLNHNYDTDILTFNYSNRLKEIDGEILISFEEARYNAIKFKVNYGMELTRLVIHGVLHLLNFDDTDSLSKKIMKKEENKLINKFNFALLAGK